MSVKVSRRDRGENLNSRVIKGVIRGAVVGAVFFFLFLTAFSAVILKFDLKGDAIKVFPFLSVALSSFIGGFVSAIKPKKNGAALGALSSVAVTAVSLVAAAVTSGTVGKTFLFAVLASFAAGVLGGISAVNIKSNRKRRY